MIKKGPRFAQVPSGKPRRVGRPEKSGDEVDRSADLLNASLDLIAEAGFEGLRTRAVAAGARVNVATLHYYFPTKESLIHAVARHLANLFQQLHGPNSNPSPGALGQLTQELSDARFYFEQHYRLLLVIEEFNRRARRDAVIRKALQPLRWYWRRNIAEMIAAGIKEGVFRSDLSPEPAAEFFVAAISGANANAESVAEMDVVLQQLERWLLKPKNKS